MKFVVYLFVCAFVTYLIRVIPLLLVKKKIENTFILSFLHYLPTSILTVMTIPAMFEATGNIWSAFAGFVMGCYLAYQEKGLMVVAIGSCVGVLIVEWLLTLIV